MKNGFGVSNAYGTLRRVLMHRPGAELDFVSDRTIEEFHFARPVNPCASMAWRRAGPFVNRLRIC